MVKKCPLCGDYVSSYDLQEGLDCEISKCPFQPKGDFLLSAVIGAATGSALLGGLLGGDLLGGIAGDMLDGDLMD